MNAKRSLIQTLFLFVLILFVAVSCAAGSEQPSSCANGGNNKRPFRDVISFFNNEVEQVFVGQFRAVREVRKEIEERVLHLNSLSAHDDLYAHDSMPAVLHLVGPSGTGKSFLAQIVAKSFFRPQDCRSAKQIFGKYFNAGSGITSAALLAGQVGMMANPATALAAAIGGGSIGMLGSFGVNEAIKNFVCSDVDSWALSCGVVHVSFSEGTEEETAATMNRFLSRLAGELSYEPNVVAVLDDFNFCRGKCQNLLKELLTQHTLSLANGQKVSTKGALIILTSDLTHFGLDIQRGEEYETALELVENAAKQHWGGDSLISTVSRLIPFAPLSDGEIVKVVDKMLNLVGKEVSVRIERKLAKMGDDDQSQDFKWSGRFVCSEKTKLRIIDHMHDSIERKNSRAIVEEFNGLLRRILRTPKPIEDRIVESKPRFAKLRRQLFGFDVSAVAGGRNTLTYNEDVRLEYNPNDPNRFLEIIIGDK